MALNSFCPAIKDGSVDRVIYELDLKRKWNLLDARSKIEVRQEFVK